MILSGMHSGVEEIFQNSSQTPYKSRFVRLKKPDDLSRFTMSTMLEGAEEVNCSHHLLNLRQLHGHGGDDEDPMKSSGWRLEISLGIHF